MKRYEQWMFAMHYKQHTKQIYRKVLHGFAGFLGRKSVATVGHVDVQRYLSKISIDGASLESVYRALGVLRLFYDFLNLGGVVNYVAPRFVKLRRPWSEGPRPLTEPQVQKLISATQTPRERALIEFFYATGCRLSEVLHLKIEDLDLDARSARVRGKLGKVRTVMFTKTSADALRGYIDGRRKGYVFVQDRPIQRGCLFLETRKWKVKWRPYRRPGAPKRHRDICFGSAERVTYEDARKMHEEYIERHKPRRPIRNLPLSQVCIRHIFRGIASRAGLKNVTPHTLRRTFATHLYNHGAGIEVIKVLMGHVWLQTTMNYARMGEDQLGRVFDRCHPREKLNEQSTS